jgi:pyrophosphatase PpaX
LSRNVDAVIFDFDGTLADTIPVIVRAWNAAMHEPLGRVFTTAEVISRFGIPDPEMIRKEVGPDAAAHAIEVYFHEYERQHDIVAAFDGIPELLCKLQQSRLPIGLMTGKVRRTADISIRRLGWHDTFGCSVTGDEVTKQKPDPEGVLRIASRFGVSPDRCIFVGDSPADIGAGKAANMITVAAAWKTHYADELRAICPDIWANDPREILEVL